MEAWIKTDVTRIHRIFALATRHDSGAFVDNQIRQTSPGIPVDDAARILSPWIDCSKLIGAPSGPAVITQERPKVCPCFPFAPGVPQGPAPAASGLVVGCRGRVEDHSDGVTAFVVAKPEQPGDECSRPFGPFGSPQLNVELEHDGEIVVEREPAS
jgi:hypothetical protein